MFARGRDSLSLYRRLGFHMRCCFPAVRLNSVITRYKHLGLFSAPQEAGTGCQCPGPGNKNLVAAAEIEEAASLWS